jgi:hypothetical protein
MRRALSLTLAASAALCLPLLGRAQDTTDVPAKQSERWSGSLGVFRNYDDNFLEYSSTEVHQFNEGTRPAKYLVTNTTDVVTTLRARASYGAEYFGEGFRSVLRGKFNRSWNRTNSFRTYTTWGLEVKQFLWDRTSVSVQFNSLPNYYLRNLFYRRYRQPSRLPSQYIAEELSKKSYGVEVNRRLGPKLALSLGYRQERATYNHEFYERSNTGREYTAGTEYRFTRSVRGTLDVAFTEVWAHGRDDFNAPAHDSLADISSRSIRLAAGGTVNLRRLTGAPLEVQPELVWEHQAYLSGKPGDIFHFGRIDRYVKFTMELRYQILRQLECSFVYSWEENRTNLGDTGDAGSYQEHRVGLGAEFNL